MVVLATIVLIVLLLGYFGLSGLDMGVSMTLRGLGRDERERRIVVATIAPYFLANEVWLVAAAGFTAGAFPLLEKGLVSRMYPILVLLLLGWLVRDLGLWLRGRVDGMRWRGFWDNAVVAGGWTVVATWGLLLGNVVRGVPDNATLFTPFPLLCAAFTLATVAGYGTWYAGKRLTGELAVRARSIRRRVRWAVPATAALALGWGLISGDLFAGSLPSSAAEPATVRLVTTATVIMLPVLLAAQLWVWRTFRGPVDRPAYL